MYYFRTLCSCFIYLFITACNTQGHTAFVEKRTELEAAPIESPEKVHVVSQQVAPQQARPKLDLSIDNLSFDDKKNSGDLFIYNKVRAAESSDLFDRINKKQHESGINFSGELLTNKNVDETSGLLNSLDGVQIEVQGRFN